jgi:hypothetical protein
MTKHLFASHVVLPAAAALMAAAPCLPAPASAADLPRPKRHRVVRVRPSVDAVQLATLAPLQPLSTAEQSYGDAPIARARAQRIFARRTTDAAAPYPCDPHVAIAHGTVCANVPGRLGDGQGYAFTPAYVTAPQISGADPGAQTSLLAPGTVLFLNADNALFGR